MSVRFKRLLTVHVAHGYYGGRCKAAGYIAPADTEGALRRGRLVAKYIEGSLCVYYEADDAGVARVSLAGRILRFGLKPTDASFSNITDLAFSPGAQVSLHGNTVDPEVLDTPTTAILAGRILRHVLSRDARPATVTVTAADGSLLREETVTQVDGRSMVSLDLAGAAAGPFTILERYPDATEAETQGYLDRELKAEAVIGIVHLAIDPSFYETPPEFTVEFAARREVLKYYVVAKNYKDKDFEALVVSDEGYEEEARDRVTFARVASGEFSAEEPSVAALGGTDASSVVLFRSQEPVPRRQGGRKSIRLKQKDDVLIENLPQPHPERASADLIVHLSKT
jgi:hypothetical protein